MKRSKKGFTLAELLIVIAIIAVLVAIMLPVFGAQLNKARAAAELANVRAKYAELLADAMLDPETSTVVGDFSVEIDSSKLAEALQYTGSSITCKNGTQATASASEVSGNITVEYKGHSGVFNTDGDVKFTSEDKIVKSAPSGT